MGSILANAFKVGKALYPLLSPLLARDENNLTVKQKKYGNGGGVPLAMHNSVSLSFPTMYGGAKHENFGAGMTLVGADFLTAIEVPAVCEQGTVLFNQRVQPSLFTNTRLSQFAPLFERYKFRRLVFVYEPIANATQTGQVIGLVDVDPSDVWETQGGLTNVRRAATYMGNMSHQVWDCGEYRTGSFDPFTDLYTNPAGTDIRMTDAGQLVIMAGSTTSIAAGEPMGNVYMMYEVEFFVSALDPSQTLNLVGSTAATFTPTALNPGGTVAPTILCDSLGAMNDVQVTNSGYVTYSFQGVAGARYLFTWGTASGTNPVFNVTFPTNNVTIEIASVSSQTATECSYDRGFYCTTTGLVTIKVTYTSGTIGNVGWVCIARMDPIQLTSAVESFQVEITRLREEVASLRKAIESPEVKDEVETMSNRSYSMEKEYIPISRTHVLGPVRR